VDVREVAQAPRRRWALVALLALLGALAGAGWSLASPDRYRTTTTLIFSLQGGSSVNDLAQGGTYTRDLLASYSRLVDLPVVLSPVVEQLDLGVTPTALARQVDVTTPSDTSLLQIAVTDGSPERAVAVADAVAAQLTTTVAGLSPDEVGGETVSVDVTVVEPAQVPDAPTAPPLAVLAAAGAVAGLVLGVALLVLLALLVTPVADRATARRLTGAPVLAEVPRGGRVGRHPAPTRSEPRAPRAEAVRVLRTNLLALQREHDVRTVVVTSPTAGGGSTTTALALAAAAAELSQRVLLVDADLRSPDAARRLGLEGTPGLADVVRGQVGLEEAVQAWGSPGLDVLPAGTPHDHPAELLGAPRTAEVLAHLRQTYDLVVLDAPALLAVTDAAALAARCDGALLVVDARSSRQRLVVDAAERLGLAGASLLGVVLGRVTGAGGPRGGADERAGAADVAVP